ncbi:hypothetical protein K1719_031567 [Acacia pycnantha]|nr:hypothetical protein K1719_031567 [Acacia pycnantha]
MAVSENGNPAVEPSSNQEKIKYTILNWKSIKQQKQQKHVPPQIERVQDFEDFSSQGTFEDIKVERKISSDIPKKAPQRVKAPEAQVETRKILGQKRIREVQKQREIARHKIDQTKDTTSFNDNKEVEGREITRIREIQKQREIARHEIDQIKNTAGFNDNMEVEREFHKIVRLGEIQRQREIARREIDQIKNTAGINDNMKAEQEFYTLTRGRSLSRDEFRRLLCFGEPLDPFFYE